MTLYRKNVLIGALCIAMSSMLIGYKAFQLNQEKQIKVQENKSEEVASWVSKAVDQKLGQLEASVSYLDKSTVESLKRFGARYFAYAYKREGEWRLKWKVLGSFGKDQILTEVNVLDFDKINLTQRSWDFNKKNEAIYIAPVDLAKTHQLSGGFLVFGLNEKFFNFLKNTDNGMSLADQNGNSIYGSLDQDIAGDAEIIQKSENGFNSIILEGEGDSLAVTSYFSGFAQLWIIQQSPMSLESFAGSTFFIYSLMSALIGLLFLALFSIRLPKVDEVEERPGFLDGLRAKLTQRAKAIDVDAVEDNGIEPNQIEKIPVADFAEFMDGVLEGEMGRLNKVGVSVRSEMEEGAKVMCSPQHISDLIQRLIGNSVLALEGVQDKEIQLQLVEQGQSYQLIYLDTRDDQFPSGEEPSLLLQTEGSLVGIDGIIAYASWLFGDALTVAKKGFCISIDLEKEAASQVVEDQISDEEVTPLIEALKTVELGGAKPVESDEDDFAPVNSIASMDEDLAAATEMAQNSLAELTQEKSVEEILEGFQMKEFDFNNEKTATKVSEEAEANIPTDDNGMVELNTGQFKLKIRSPKKRDKDVNR